MYRKTQMAILPLLPMLWICENLEFVSKELFQTETCPIWSSRYLATATFSHQKGDINEFWLAWAFKFFTHVVSTGGLRN